MDIVPQYRLAALYCKCQSNLTRHKIYQQALPAPTPPCINLHSLIYIIIINYNYYNRDGHFAWICQHVLTREVPVSYFSFLLFITVPSIRWVLSVSLWPSLWVFPQCGYESPTCAKLTSTKSGHSTPDFQKETKVAVYKQWAKNRAFTGCHG